MNANWRRSQAAPYLGRVAFEKYKVRASLEEELTRKAQEFDDRRWEELNAYATAVDAWGATALKSDKAYKGDDPRHRGSKEDVSVCLNCSRPVCNGKCRDVRHK